MTEEAVRCVQPAAGPLVSAPQEAPAEGASTSQTKEVQVSRARVGEEAPNFEAAAYYQGSFKNVRLSDYRGQWVVLCFYPGDFTFV